MKWGPFGEILKIPHISLKCTKNPKPEHFVPYSFEDTVKRLKIQRGYILAAYVHFGVHYGVRLSS